MKGLSKCLANIRFFILEGKGCWGWRKYPESCEKKFVKMRLCRKSNFYAKFSNKLSAVKGKIGDMIFANSVKTV